MWQTIGGIICTVLAFPCWAVFVFCAYLAGSLFLESRSSGWGIDFPLAFICAVFSCVGLAGGIGLSVLAYLAFR